MAAYLKKFKLVSGLTVVSRIMGLARDWALAHVLGATGDFVMSAYSQAFVMPNLLRRLFGEGALSASFIPIFTEYLESGDRRAANRFMSLMIVLLVTVLSAAVLVIVGVLLLARHLTAGVAKWHLIFGLAAVMFPFGITICLVALLQAALNCRQHFVMPALAPILLNLVIIAGSILAASLAVDDRITQAYVIAGSILVAGVLQVALQVPAMRREGLRFRPVWDLAHPGLRRVLRLMGPMVLAIGVVQFNTFMDATIANLFSPYDVGAESFRLGGREVAYPMATGAAAVLYYAQRLYNFPLGVFAIALATVIFPELSRLASRRDSGGIARTASHGIRLTLFISLPAGVGLALVAEPLLRLWLEHGRFAEDPEAIPRTLAAGRTYLVGIWAYAANHILLRTFYALKDTRTPLRVAMVAAGVNLVLNLVLIWPLAECGLALATAVSAAVQGIVLALLLHRKFAELRWGAIGASAGRTVLATGVMAAAVWAAMEVAAPALGLAGTADQVARLVAGVAAGAVAFGAVAWALRMDELRDLVSRRP